MRLGPYEVIDFAKSVGIETDLSPNPGLALGIDESSLLMMTGAYGTFANQGKHHLPYFIDKILTQSGEVVYKHESSAKRVLTGDEAMTINHMLRLVVEQGTGGRLRWHHGITRPTTGKTGTTQHMADGWYLGSTPKLTGGAWMGGNNNGVRFRFGGYGNGSRSALPIWAGFLARMEKDSVLRQDIGDAFAPLPSRIKAQFYCAEFTPPEEDLFLDAIDSIDVDKIVPLKRAAISRD